MMTTKTVGIGEANPKPVRHINWTGQPMNEGDDYWGESKPQPQRDGRCTETACRAKRARKAG
jgi:hypothetical protein